MYWSEERGGASCEILTGNVCGDLSHALHHISTSNDDDVENMIVIIIKYK